MKSIYNLTANTTGTMYYCGAMVYDQTKTLQYILTDEGRMLPEAGGKYIYEYNLKDHLGNTRVVFQITPTGNTPVVVQETNYYAFGSEIAALSYNSGVTPKNKYLYNGKEKQTVDNGDVAFCMDWLDYGARNYDSWVGRFWTQDRFAEKYVNLSPYQYAANNPIKFIDVNGDSIYINYTTRERRTGFLSNVFKYKPVSHTLTYTTDGTYNEDGSEYAGGNDFANNVINALDGLNSTLNELGSDAGDFQNMISDMASDEKSKVKIKEFDGLFGSSEGTLTRGSIYWNDNLGPVGDDTYGKTNKIFPAITLFHELGHRMYHNNYKNHGGSGKEQHVDILKGEKKLAKSYQIGYRTQHKKILGYYETSSPFSLDGIEKIW